MKILNTEINYRNAQHLWYVAGINGAAWLVCIIALGALPQFSILESAAMLIAASIGFCLTHEFGHALVWVYYGLEPKITFEKEIYTSVPKRTVTTNKIIVATIGGVLAGYLFLGCFCLVTGNTLLPAIMFVWSTLKMSLSEYGDLRKLLCLASNG